MSSSVKQVRKSIFEFYYTYIYHMMEDTQWALGDYLRDEFDEATLKATQGVELESELHQQIMKKLEEIRATL